MVRVTGLHLYPVKSCRGLAVTSAEVDARGFVGDRRFLIVDREYQFLTQRVLPRMALVETALTDRGLELGSPGHGSIAVPLLSPLDPRSSSLSVTVWHDTVAAEDCGEEPAAWLSEFLGVTCRLVRAGSAYARPIPARKVPSTLSLTPNPAQEVSFADGFPFLVIGEESLADLNARLAAPLPMNRFRPSLVVAGAAAYAEDTWTLLRIGPVRFHAASRCARCAITTTDQLTAERAAEPLRTLAGYRRDADGSVLFGRNLIHETKAGRVSVGNPVELL